MEVLSGILYSLSSAFLVPTLVAVLALFVCTTYLVGQMLSEALDRRANRAGLDKCRAEGLSLSGFLRQQWRGRFAAVGSALSAHGLQSVFVDRRVTDIETALRARIEKLAIVSRAGPMLGLIGTLIPLQPALAGLAEGNMQQMASNLLLGFTTTVIGLVIGGVAFGLGTITRIWGRSDLIEIRFLLERWREEEEQSYASQSTTEIAAAGLELSR